MLGNGFELLKELSFEDAAHSQELQLMEQKQDAI
jgi:hypothetical protein